MLDYGKVEPYISLNSDWDPGTVKLVRSYCTRLRLGKASKVPI